MQTRIDEQIAQIRHTDNTRRELVAHVSHDLRTPLTSIMGAVDILGMADALGFELVEKATIARGDTDFTALVGDLNGAGCEVVYAVTVATEQNGILGQALGDGFEPVWLGALPSYLSLFAQGAPDRYENFYVTLDSPDFSETTIDSGPGPWGRSMIDGLAGSTT